MLKEVNHRRCQTGSAIRTLLRLGEVYYLNQFVMRGTPKVFDTFTLVDHLNLFSPPPLPQPPGSGVCRRKNAIMANYIFTENVIMLFREHCFCLRMYAQMGIICGHLSATRASSILGYLRGRCAEFIFILARSMALN